MVCCEYAKAFHLLLSSDPFCRNPGGIRFGSSEIYNVLETCFSFSEERKTSDAIEDALVVAQSIDGGTDERVILFVKLCDRSTLSQALEKKINLEIRSRRSPRHVPARVCSIFSCSLERFSDRPTGTCQIIQVDDIPYTLNGKRVEIPVKKVHSCDL